MTKQPSKIFFDWGGTIIRDADLFNDIASKSNSTRRYKDPNDWKDIRTIGNLNHFEDIKSKFFERGETYPYALNVVSKYTGHSLQAKSQSFVIFDGSPIINGKKDALNIQFLLSKALSKKNAKSNGIFVESNKVQLAKSLGCEILVEDDPRIALAAASAGIKVVLMLRKWNRVFSLESLSLLMKPKNFETITSKMFLAEDWIEADSIIDSLLGVKENG